MFLGSSEPRLALVGGPVTALRGRPRGPAWASHSRSTVPTPGGAPERNTPRGGLPRHPRCNDRPPLGVQRNTRLSQLTPRARETEQSPCSLATAAAAAHSSSGMGERFCRVSRHFPIRSRTCSTPAGRARPFARAHPTPRTTYVIGPGGKLRAKFGCVRHCGPNQFTPARPSRAASQLATQGT